MLKLFFSYLPLPNASLFGFVNYCRDFTNPLKLKCLHNHWNFSHPLHVPLCQFYFQLCTFFPMLIICNVHFWKKKTFERLQFLTKLKDKTIFTHFSQNFSNVTMWLFQVFLRKSEKLINGTGREGGSESFQNKIKNEQQGRWLYGTEENAINLFQEYLWTATF